MTTTDADDDHVDVAPVAPLAECEDFVASTDHSATGHASMRPRRPTIDRAVGDGEKKRK